MSLIISYYDTTVDCYQSLGRCVAVATLNYTHLARIVRRPVFYYLLFLTKQGRTWKLGIVTRILD